MSQDRVSLLRRFVSGAVFGAGFTVAVVVILTAYVWIVNSVLFGERGAIVYPASPEQVGAAPPPVGTRRFLGAPAIYSGDFMANTSPGTAPVLAPGEGEMRGQVTANGLPIQGVRIRLALNSSVMSTWAVTDSQGYYVVPVPFGEYQIDGYELDDDIADSLLVGKIDHPQNPYSSGVFTVSPESPGRALTLRYVDPVAVIGPTGNVSRSTGVVVSWESYPGATGYKLQLYANEDPYDSPGSSSVFPWGQRPTVRGTSIDLAPYASELKTGFYYTVEIEALDERDRPMSKTPRNSEDKNFRLTE